MTKKLCGWDKRFKTQFITKGYLEFLSVLVRGVSQQCQKSSHIFHL